MALLLLWKQYGFKRLGQVCLCLVGFAGLFLYQVQQANSAYRSAPSKLQHIQIIPATLSVNGDLLSFRGKADGRTYQAFYRLSSENEQKWFKNLSQTVLLSGDIELAEATPQRNFGGFDYRTYLKHEGIYRMATVSEITEIKAVSSLTFVERLHEWRRQAIVSIQQHFPAPMQHYMTGLLFGYLDKSFAEMSDIYTSLGIIHLFALSGMQVGFFVGIFRTFFLRLGLRRDQVTVLQMPFSFVYARLTGFSVSVIRSLLQAILAPFGIKRLDNLALTMLSLFLVIPSFLLTTGGVLSLAFAFILSLVQFDDLTRYSKIFAESIAISLGSLPLLIYFFSVFQPLSIVLTAVSYTHLTLPPILRV